MRMRAQDGGTTELSTLDLPALSDDERTYLEVMLALVVTGDMFHGRFVETHVARLIGADVPDVGISPWDLWVASEPPITVEVKATRHGGEFSLSGKSSQVWVFVTYPNKKDHHFGYVVASAAEVAALQQAQMRQAKLFEKLGPAVPADRLAAAVREKAAITG
ncbi:MAG: hypothetical protein Q7V57_08890 [Actinomycetota bacterium]|nr:hypothetical protein [Actinomycetota bacterium]